MRTVKTGFPLSRTYLRLNKCNRCKYLLQNKSSRYCFKTNQIDIMEAGCSDFNPAITFDGILHCLICNTPFLLQKNVPIPPPDGISITIEDQICPECLRT